MTNEVKVFFIDDLTSLAIDRYPREDGQVMFEISPKDSVPLRIVFPHQMLAIQFFAALTAIASDVAEERNKDG